MNFDSLLSGDNAGFIDTIYLSWLNDPSSVDPEWAQFFEQQGDAEPVGAYQTNGFVPKSIFNAGSGVTESHSTIVAHRQAKVDQLINAYRVRGHTEADIDPLGRRRITAHPELTLEYYGLTENDLDCNVSGQSLNGVPKVTTLRHIIRRLRTAYCGGFGVEFMNINDPIKKKWLQSRFETLQDSNVLERDEELHMLRLLTDAENFEQFLHNRYPGTKRFSLEGAETLIPLLALLIDESENSGVERVMLGMAHRGRLNVLANILNKPIRYILDEFDDEAHLSFDISGDVKYHLGYSNNYITSNGNPVRVTLAFNPSHLEAVNTVVLGRSKARQDRVGENGRKAIMPLLIHGDAAFAGQGIVAETLQLARLPGYETGGTVHVIINNQIGFTTSPSEARSTPYCSDVARMMAIPIFHVNGEDVEAVAAVAKIAAEWRQTFHEDVVIDLYCYRKWGHNEGDEPSFTQPLLYDVIRKQPSARIRYAQKMVRERGDLNESDVEKITQDSQKALEAHLDYEVSYQDNYTSVGDTPQRRLWAEYVGANISDAVDTTLKKSVLIDLLSKSNTLPDSLQAHRKIKRIIGQRLKAVTEDTAVDWAIAEQAAYATLVHEGYRVRLSGQDCGRGTFSHRHAVVSDILSGERFLPLDNLSENQARFEVHNSPLAEFSVLGFEHGYTLDWPDGLVLWEAQFGDFANGAQVIIDNFIMASEQKWARDSGLVMLLPHGYTGQGPEHSSARLERYLQLCAEENVVVANCTTPANFYHLLRRQVLQKVRKPLVVMSPKSLLRHPKCVSTLDDLAKGEFKPLYPDQLVDPKGVNRVVFCSGKLYYELLKHRESIGNQSVALVRLERLYPLPKSEVIDVMQTFPDAELIWCQEEPRNMGAWPMMDEWIGEALGRIPRYIGRKAAASPSTGSPSIHRQTQQALIEDVFKY